MGDSYRHTATLWDQRDSEKKAATIGESERQPATTGDSERHTATPWDQRDSERMPTTMGDSERHVATLLDWRNS